MPRKALEPAPENANQFTRLLLSMEQIKDIIFHLDTHLDNLFQSYGLWIYAILFLIIFCETGLVVTPFLPGDSLLFAVGALAARAGGLDLLTVMAIMFLAAFCGDNVNYWIGKKIGSKAYKLKRTWYFNPGHLAKAHEFYERHGGKTIIMARFVPVIRTFVPFVAGVGTMRYRRFIGFSVAGSALWIGSLTLLGYVFGNMPAVKNNFTIVILAIIFVSMLPVMIETFRHWKAGTASRNEPK